MTRLPAELEPTLQPPGAGLPPTERWVAQLMLGWQARWSRRESSAARFARERRAIMDLVRTGDPATDARRVLIPRPTGLEDSSRFWSVYMTLDHLRIVNDGTAALIGLLGRGQTPARVTGTADVKPSTEVGATVVRPFEQACERFERSVAAVDDLRGTPRWPHPWFGPLNAAEWHFLTAFHMGLHRRQIENIRRHQCRI